MKINKDYLFTLTVKYSKEIEEEMFVNKREVSKLARQITFLQEMRRTKSHKEDLATIIERNQQLIDSSSLLIKRQKQLLEKYRYWNSFLDKIMSTQADDDPRVDIQDFNENIPLSAEITMLSSLLEYYEEQEEYEVCHTLKQRLDAIGLCA